MSIRWAPHGSVLIKLNLGCAAQNNSNKRSSLMSTNRGSTSRNLFKGWDGTLVIYLRSSESEFFSDKVIFRSPQRLGRVNKPEPDVRACPFGQGRRSGCMWVGRPLALY